MAIDQHLSAKSFHQMENGIPTGSTGGDLPVSCVMRSLIHRELGVRDDLVFDHEGRIGDEEVRSLLDLAERHSLGRCDPVMVRKRLFSVLVEGLENINRHAGEWKMNAGAILADRPHGYDIFLGNAMPLASCAMMRLRIEMLNEMEDAVLKEHYMMLLANEGRTEKGGAGIGLFTMARKCDRPMQVYATNLNENMACIVLGIRVARV
jgi:hypothetical protein